MTDTALEHWLRDWRAAHPQLESAWVFLREGDRTFYGAFAALESEWLEAVYAIRESQVAAAKLQWWREELRMAQDAHARHPLTQALFGNARSRAISPTWWEQTIAAALARLDVPPAPDFAAQLAQAQPLHGALARIETALWFGAHADPARAQRVASLEYLIAALRQLPQELAHNRSPLPMNLLARHGLTQASLGEDSGARRAALRDQAHALRQAIDEAAKLVGPLSLFRGVQTRQETHALRAAERAADPLHVLHGSQNELRLLFDAWGAARVWRGLQKDS
ncbi:MAG: squalene/phytoene synthase family protein [Rhodanobacteraceae bacterium]